MRHQPFETWIVDETGLTPEQMASLKEHLLTCEECRQFQNSWASVRGQLMAAHIAAPAPGFTKRWNISLAERRRQQQKLQERRLLLFLVTGAMASLLMLVAYLFATTSPASLLVSVFETVTHLLVTWTYTQQAILPLVEDLPPVIPIAFWILLTTGISLLSVIWVVTIWRISPKGVHSK